MFVWIVIACVFAVIFAKALQYEISARRAMRRRERNLIDPRAERPQHADFDRRVLHAVERPMCPVYPIEMARIRREQRKRIGGAA